MQLEGVKENRRDAVSAEKRAGQRSLMAITIS